MYDSEYFRKVIGDNYNPNELYHNTTYNKNEGGNVYTVSNNEERKIYEVNTRNVAEPTSNQPITENYNVNTAPISVKTYENANKAPVSDKPYEQPVNKINTEQYVNTKPTSQQLRYPEIYNVLNPMVNTVLANNQNIEYNEATINAMSNEIYNALEVDVNPTKTTNEVSTFNNNTVQVNAKPKNYVLHDLIKIMLIGKIEKNK